MKRLIPIALVASAIAMVSPRPASAQALFDNGGPSVSNSFDITVPGWAEDFTLSTSSGIGRLEFYVSDFEGPFDLTGGEFNGQFSWLIYDDIDFLPGNVLASGTVGIGQFRLDDTGIVDDFGSNVNKLTIVTPLVTLDAGNYWIRVKEGTTTSNSDGSSIFWQSTDTPTIDGSAVSPSAQFLNWNNDPANMAFAIYAAPEPGSAALALGILPIVGMVVRRKRQK